MTTFGERLTGSDRDAWPPFAASDIAAYDGSPLRELQDHRIDLTLGNSRAVVRLGGDIDMVAAGDLSGCWRAWTGSPPSRSTSISPQCGSLTPAVCSPSSKPPDGAGRGSFLRC